MRCNLCIRRDLGKEPIRIPLWRYDEYADRIFPILTDSLTAPMRYLYYFMDESPRLWLTSAFRYRLMIRDSDGRMWFAPLCDTSVTVEGSDVDATHHVFLDYARYGGAAAVEKEAKQYSFGDTAVAMRVGDKKLYAFNSQPAYYDTIGE